MENGIRFRRAFRGFEIVIPAASIRSVELDSGRNPSRPALKIAWEKDGEAVVSSFWVSSSSEVTEEFKKRIGKLIGER